MRCSTPISRNFNPRSPHGERQRLLVLVHGDLLFQPTLPARGATFRAAHRFPHGGISTHAPRTGSDLFRVLRRAHIVISTHAPRTGSDMGSILSQSAVCYFNPRSPHGERPPAQSEVRTACISTHAPRTGSDFVGCPYNSQRLISTHAPRTGSDCHNFLLDYIQQYFNPRSPHGERRSSQKRLISPLCDFNPRSPHGERRLCPPFIHPMRTISTHAPRTGSDSLYGRTVSLSGISTHAPRTGSDYKRMFVRWFKEEFQPTLPARGATER